MAGEKTEMGIIAELEAFGPGLGRKGFEDFPWRDFALGRLSNANRPFLEFRDAIDKRFGDLFFQKKFNERVTLRHGLVAVQVLFHHLDHEEASDLRPTNLGEKAFEVDPEDFFGLLHEVLHKRHEFAAAFLEALPFLDQAAGLGREGFGRGLFEMAVKSLEEAGNIPFGAENGFEGLIILAVERGLFDT